MTFAVRMSAYVSCLFAALGAHSSPPLATPLDPLLDGAQGLGANPTAVHVAREQARLLPMTVGYIKGPHRLALAQLLAKGCKGTSPDTSLLNSFFGSNDPTLVAAALNFYAECRWQSPALASAFEQWLPRDDAEVAPALAYVVAQDVAAHLAWAWQLENSQHHFAVSQLIYAYSTLKPAPIAIGNLLRVWDKKNNYNLKSSILFQANKHGLDLAPFLERLEKDIVDTNSDNEYRNLYIKFQNQLDFQKARQHGQAPIWVAQVLMKGQSPCDVAHELAKWDAQKALELVEVMIYQYPMLVFTLTQVKEEIQNIIEINTYFTPNKPQEPRPQEVLNAHDLEAFRNRLNTLKQRALHLSQGQLGSQPPILGVALSGSFGKGYWKASSDGDLVVLCPQKKQGISRDSFMDLFHLDAFAGHIYCTPQGRLEGSLERLFAGAVVDPSGEGALWVHRTMESQSPQEFQGLRHLIQFLNANSDTSTKMANRLDIPHPNRWRFDLLLKLWATPRHAADLLEPFAKAPQK